MIRQSSPSSQRRSYTNQQIIKDPNKHLFKHITEKLQKASKQFNSEQFQLFYEKLLTKCITKSEIQKSQRTYLPFLKKLATQYKPSLEISVRLLLLQVRCQYLINPQDSYKMLTKAKHMIIETQLQYLMSKVFLLQAQIFNITEQNSNNSAYKSLKKCIDFTDNYIVNYLKEKKQIRKQIAENIVVAFFQLYKLKKQTNPKQAQQYLSKAFRSSEKNYGEQSYVSDILGQVFANHKNIRTNVDKLSINMAQSKAITQIMDSQIKKNTRVNGFYSWQDEKLIVQIIREKNFQRKILAQTQYAIKLDIGRINALRSIQWVQIINGQVFIQQDEVLKASGVKQQHISHTRIGLKNISRQQIIKRQDISSSSEDASFIEKEDFNFIRRLGGGRAQSAKRQEN